MRRSRMTPRCGLIALVRPSDDLQSCRVDYYSQSGLWRGGGPVSGMTPAEARAHAAKMRKHWEKLEREYGKQVDKDGGE